MNTYLRGVSSRSQDFWSGRTEARGADVALLGAGDEITSPGQEGRTLRSTPGNRV